MSRTLAGVRQNIPRQLGIFNPLINISGMIGTYVQDMSTIPFARTRISFEGKRFVELSSASVKFTDYRLLRVLQRLFIYSNPEAIDSFLSTRPNLISLLFDISQQLPEFFPSVQPRLVLRRDDENASYVVVQIPTTESLDDAFAHMQRFDEQWWFDAMSSANGKIVVDLALE